MTLYNNIIYNNMKAVSDSYDRRDLLFITDGVNMGHSTGDSTEKTSKFRNKTFY